MKAALALSALALAASVPASADPLYSTVYVFGDSLSDRGRIPGLIEEQSPGFPFTFPVSPPYFDARFSNGPTYAERLPDLLGIAPAPGQNFAVGGAETGDDNITDSLLPPSIELPGIAEQIDSFVSSGESIGSEALVVLYGGSNDYFGFLEENADPTSGEISDFVGVTIGNIEEDIRSLAAAGATTILVPNVPNLGATPSYSGTGQEAAATALAAEHAAALNDQLGALGDELGVEIVVADFATGFDLLLSDPARFGVTDVTTPCVTSSSGLPAYVTPGTVCTEAEQATRLFWDSVHPTSIGHELLAGYAADTLAAPTTLAAQAELAAIAGDDFLRRIDQALEVGFGAAAIAPSETGAAEKPYEVFLAGKATAGERDFEGSALGFDYTIASVTGGVTFRPIDDVTLGLAGGYDRGDADLDDWDASTDLTSYRIGAMAGYDGGTLFASAGLAYGFDDYDLERQTYVPELSSSADADGGTFGAYGSAGYRFTLGRLSVGPIAGLRYTHVHVDSFDESGAPGLDMHVEEQDAEDLIGSAGIGAATSVPLGSATLTPHLELTLEGDLLDDGRTITTALVTVPDVGRHLQVEASGGAYGRLAGGLLLDFQPGFSARLDGEATLGRDGGDEYAVFGLLSARF